MSDAHHLHFHLEPDLRQAAALGEHPFIAKMALVLESAGFRVEYRDHGDTDRSNDTYVLSHMKPPPEKRGLVFRRVYEYPFWQIDGSAQRWEWDVAKSAFDPALISGPEAAQFYEFWQKRQYQNAPRTTSRDGFVYIPLQGHLTEHRSFQSCSPIAMVEHCLAHDKTRQVIATIHPTETYTDTEIAALEALERKYPRLRVDVGDMIPLLQTCDYVVSQNSSVAFAGYFFGKPALLFGDIDFHHIAVRADMDRLADSFAQVQTHRPDYAKYLYWFWQDQSINAGRDDVYGKIAARFRRFDWPID
ncbi:MULTISPECIES: hypothetical protein [unclassified Sulfitobacter]|uniref:hypothetical protein n=1 Tax=unclassified Sulfitobacter TaxID=196795 RepID=UPI001594256E|nr:hypothetical protein [Sulfitobacter sp. HGT1]